MKEILEATLSEGQGDQYEREIIKTHEGKTYLLIDKYGKEVLLTIVVDGGVQVVVVVDLVLGDPVLPDVEDVVVMQVTHVSIDHLVYITYTARMSHHDSVKLYLTFRLLLIVLGAVPVAIRTPAPTRVDLLT